MAEDSSDDVERTSLTAGKIPDVASAGPFKRPGVLISAVGTHVAAVALLAMMWHTLKKALSPEAPLLTWRTFPLHPFLMTLAFGFLSPVAAAAWRSYEHLLGFTHRQVKVFHGVLMGVAALTGLLGVIDMWLVHEDGAAAQVAKGWAVHFQSAHSWVGIVALALFLLQATGGAAAFALPLVPPAKRAALLAPHRWLGAAAAQQAAFVALITGILSLAGRGDNVKESDVGYKAAAVVALLLSLLLGLLLQR